MAFSDLQTEYVGKRGRLFGLAFRASLLTILTLGLYRFWMKTRLRRFYWSAVRPGGQPLEYVGEPLEKLLGFLIAVVFLAFYIGIVNLVLMFLSFSLLNNNFAAYAVSLLGLVPILFYARFRARRYILARTRWRGVRFGMQTGAWGYSWRAMLHWLITIITLGLLWPRMTFSLEKYRTDLTFFGSHRFDQGGHWQMLYRPFLPLLLGMISAASGAYAIYQHNQTVGASLGGIGAALALYGLVHYRVHSFRILAANKTLGGARFVARPRPWRVIGIYVLGHAIVMSILALFLGLIVAGIFGVAFAVIGQDAPGFDPVEIGGSMPIWINTTLAVLLYFTAFLTWGVLRQVFVTLPLARHYAETLEIIGASSLAEISQRPRDEFTEAEGFADALDVGAAL